MRISFRGRIIGTFVVLCCAFLLLVYPLVNLAFHATASEIVHKRIQFVIDVLKRTSSEREMIQYLQSISPTVALHFAVYDANGHVLFDQTQEKKEEPFQELTQEQMQTIQEKGKLSGLVKSEVFDDVLIYQIEAFAFQENIYFIKASVAAGAIEVFFSKIKMDFFLFCILCFLFFASCFFLLFHWANYPIRHIIKTIVPFQEGKEEFIAPIVLPKSIDERDQFYQLAQTLNALSTRVRTQIKHTLEERDEKEAILESLGEGVIAVDQDMYIRCVNYIGSRMFGFPRKHLAGKSFKDLAMQVQSPLMEKCKDLLETCQKNMRILTDSLFIADGKKMYLDLIAAPKPMHKGAILVLQDKSSHYKILEMGKDFVANASHELRTPITIIRGFAETLHDLPELPKEMVSDITEKIVRNCQRMDNLVKNLLTLADLENIPESRFQECDLIVLMENARQVVLSIYQDADIRIEKRQEAIIVNADADILELAVINLLDNAAKYSTPPAQITIKVEQSGDEAHILIKDKGIGIPTEDLEHIFERFYTVNKAHSRRLGGAGLGLSIVKTIIEKHHGTISVASVFQQGTIFTIKLPIRRLSHF